MSNYQLSLKEKIGQLFMVGFKGTEVPEESRKFIESNNIGSVILFARNVDTLPQVEALTASLHSLAKVPPFIYTDQEGGTVVQFKELAATVISPMGLTATGDPANARLAGRIIGEEMKAVGIDGVLAPTLDVNFEENNPIIGIRSFSDNPDVVINYGSEFAAGLNEKGVVACGKHYPGHGGTIADSHMEIPRVPISPEYFFRNCYSPFLVLAQKGLDAIMTSHVLFPAISNSIATFCPRLINGLLRQKAGYNGVIISDCLEMMAVKKNFSPEEIIMNTMNAGLDINIVSHNLAFQEELLETLLFYVKKGKIPEKRIDDSLSRVLKLKKKYCPQKKENFSLFKSKDKDQNKTKESAYGRNHLKEEQKIADQSITMLRNGLGLIPINPKKKILIIEWEKVKATMSVSSAENKAMLMPTAEKYLDNVDVEILELAMPLPDDMPTRLKEYDCIIAALYSRSPVIIQLQAEALKEILEIRSDVVVVSLGNPYDIRHFRFVETYLLSYGFRTVQVEALFKVLTGKLMPIGKIPVHIKSLFPQGFSYEESEDYFR
ncbi:MAG: beta-N-acetylhexosaminidase [bacterium]|nr:beta-N-acetylhexosaminidase [bacterium]